MLNSPKTAYTDEQFSASYPDGYDDHYWTIARSQMVLHEIRQIERDTSQNLGKILEIGCGRGFVVGFMRAHERDCYGVEPSTIKDPVPTAAPYLFSSIDCVDLPAAFRSAVEAILLLDVVEHIEDPVDFLSRIRIAYPNAKWIIIHVPARMEIWSNFDSCYGHFRRYDPRLLAQHLEEAGYMVERSRYCFILLYFGMWGLVRLLRSKRPLTRKRPRPKSLHLVASYYFRAESWLLRRTGIYGSSILAVAKIAPPRAPVAPGSANH